MLARTVLSVVFAALLLPAIAAAQIPGIVLDPTTIEFNASTDHATVDLLTGVAAVTKYEVFFSLYPTGGVVSTLDLGKPTPNADGKIVQVIPFTWMLPNVPYKAIVDVVGPDGRRSPSAPSNPFGHSAPLGPPAAVQGSVTVRQ